MTGPPFNMPLVVMMMQGSPPTTCSRRSGESTWMKQGARNGFMPVVEDLVPEVGVQVLRVGGVDGRRLPDHPVEVDVHPGDPVEAHPLLEGEHDLLGPAHGKGRDEDLAPRERRAFTIS